MGLSDTALNALQKGIGVSTTRARLQHQYGADYRFEFHRLPQGLAVIVAVPWRTAAPPAADVAEQIEPRRRGARPTSGPWAPRARAPDRGCLALEWRPTTGVTAGIYQDDHMKKIRTLIVDDEPLARERLVSLLSAEPDIEIVGQCRDGEEAVTAIMDHSPDLVYLDVQMPQMNGFEVIEAVGLREDAARDLRHRLRSACAQGLPGPRARLPAQAVRPRTLHRGAAARAQADRAQRDRRSRQAAARAREGPAQGPAARPSGWS